jgi:endonuclease/exonuclease/phosphatase family metal-dependent hydrolase
MAKLRIVSYNIHKGRSLSGRDSLASLRLGLHGLDADILFLQEVQGRNQQKANLDAQHESLAAALRMQVAYGCNAIRARTDHGNALLSRYPIVSFENEDVSDHALEQRGLLHGQLEIQGRRVHCFVVHLGLFSGSRVRQVQTMAQRIERLVAPEEPVLIAGDFNDWRNELAPLFVKQLGVHEVFTHCSQAAGGMSRLRASVRQFSDVLRGQQPLNALSRDRQPRQNQVSMNGVERLQPPPKTYPSKFPMLRLDRIYQRGFAVNRAQVLRGKPWSLLSDHSPIVADLELE